MRPQHPDVHTYAETLRCPPLIPRPTNNPAQTGTLQCLHWVTFIHPPLASRYPVARFPQRRQRRHHRWAAKGSRVQEMNRRRHGETLPYLSLSLGKLPVQPRNTLELIRLQETSQHAPATFWLRCGCLPEKGIPGSSSSCLSCFGASCFGSPFKCHLPPAVLLLQMLSLCCPSISPDFFACEQTW